MPSLFIADAPEWTPVLDQVAARREVTLQRHPAHIEVIFDGELVVDRSATGLRHALWYSCVAGVRGAHVEQFDKTCLRLVADDA
jgi:hypothetical protein